MAENVKDKITVQDIQTGKRDFLSLDFSNAEHREVALACMNDNQLLARKLDINVPNQLELLKIWIAKEFEYLLVLNPGQRCKELLDIYIEQKFDLQLFKWEMEKHPYNGIVSIIHSYTKQLLLCFNYKTKEGEAVSYFDENLGMPVKLKTSADIKLKVIDSLKLVQKIDIELESFDLSLTINAINNIVADSLRATVLEVIDAHKLSYYDLPRYSITIRDLLVKKMQPIFAAYGLEIAELKLSDICLTSNVGEQLENQYFALSKMARVKDFENRQEERSLKFYEQKAAIHAKYPNFQLGLTEAEKDLALDRYLKRVQKYEEAKGDIETAKLDPKLDTDPIRIGAGITEPQKPDDLKPNWKFRIGFGIGVLLWLALTIAFSLIEDLTTVGIIIGAVGAVILLGVGFCYRYQLAFGVSKERKQSYDQAMKTYKANLKAYQERDIHVEQESHDEKAENKEPQAPQDAEQAN